MTETCTANIGVSTVTKSKQETERPSGCIEGHRQTSDLRLRWNWTEAGIWSDSMLTALENGVKGGKWFSLIDKVMRPRTLLLAWERVRGNRGAGGVDGVTIDKFEANCLKYLEEIQKDLLRNTYRPQAVKRVYIPKAKGQRRPLGIPSIKDRVTQMAVKIAIEPIFEHEFHERSYGFRPQRGAKDALRKVDQCLREGYTHVVDVDFESFFDTIPHDSLMRLVEEKISDGRVLKLIESFLAQDIMEGMDRWTPTQGTPQGGVISPLLANIYLNPLDHLIAGSGMEVVRYADDFVIMLRSAEEAEVAKALVLEWSQRAGLTVHPEKSKIVDYAAGESFEYLGYRFEKGQRYVRDKSMTRMRDTIRSRTRRTVSGSMREVIRSLNRTLRGWYEYFKHSHPRCLGLIDGFVRRRLRSIYRQREKRPGFGSNLNDHKRWPNVHFAKLGLFTTLDAQIRDKRVRVRAMACQSR